MVKQALSQTCMCGQAITFPEGEVKTVCQCGAIWEIDNGGFWFSNFIIPFTIAKPRQRNSTNYDSYMKRRVGNKRRKAGSRC